MTTIEDRVREAGNVYLMDAGDLGIRASVVLPDGDEYRHGSGYGETADEATANAIADAEARITTESDAA